MSGSAGGHVTLDEVEQCGLLCDASLNADVRMVVVLVHGTRARHAPWTLGDDSPLRRILRRSGVDELRIARLVWSGRNVHLDRVDGAASLVRAVGDVRRECPHAKIVLVGHSHGGTVIAYAMRRLRDEVAGVCFIATPFLSVEPRRGARESHVGWLLPNALKALTVGAGGIVGVLCFMLAAGPAVYTGERVEHVAELLALIVMLVVWALGTVVFFVVAMFVLSLPFLLLAGSARWMWKPVRAPAVRLRRSARFPKLAPSLHVLNAQVSDGRDEAAWALSVAGDGVHRGRVRAAMMAMAEVGRMSWDLFRSLDWEWVGEKVGGVVGGVVTLGSLGFAGYLTWIGATESWEWNGWSGDWTAVIWDNAVGVLFLLTIFVLAFVAVVIGLALAALLAWIAVVIAAILLWFAGLALIGLLVLVVGSGEVSVRGVGRVVLGWPRFYAYGFPPLAWLGVRARPVTTMGKIEVVPFLYRGRKLRGLFRGERVSLNHSLYEDVAFQQRFEAWFARFAEG